MIIDLDVHLEYKSACQLSWCSELFSTPLSQTLTKPKVSLLTSFYDLKLDHRFGFPLDKQACTPTFTTFQAIFTTFKPNPSENAWESFTFEQFLKLKFDHRFECPFDRQVSTRNFGTFQNISAPLIPTLAKPYNQVSLLTNFSELKFDRIFI